MHVHSVHGLPPHELAEVPDIPRMHASDPCLAFDGFARMFA